MLTNYHTHTYRCLHAAGTEKDYTLEAIKKGLSILGFSDHAPFPDRDFGLRMSYSELDDYIGEIEKLRKKFGDTIQLYKGLEIEYLPYESDYYPLLFKKHGLDYLLLGEHLYLSPDGKTENIFFAKSTADYLSYAAAICEAVQTGYFSAVAHPDIMFINDYAWDDNCYQASEMIISCASDADIPLEYNVNGFRRQKMPFPDGLRYPYPHEQFWKMAAKRNIRVIIGSDAHVPEQLHDRYVYDAMERASALGLNVIDTLDLYKKE